MAGFIVAFTGERGVGKDHLTLSVKRHLESKGKKVIRLSFSDEVRRIAYFTFPWLESIKSEDKNTPLLNFPDNPGNLSWRDIIKMVGKLCRDVDPAFFVKRWKENQYPQVLEAQQDTVFVITDLRTEDEYQVLKEMNIPIIKITADTGLVPDDFEEWVRNFDSANFIVHNNMDVGSEETINSIFDTITSVNVNETDLISLLHKQNQVNYAYAGEDWVKQSSFAKYSMAADREFAEFSDEITSSWAWWKQKQVFYLNKALIEFCDYICFSLSTFILMDATVQETHAPYQYNILSVEKDFDNYYPRLKKAQHWRSNMIPEVATQGLLDEINLTLDFLGITREQFLTGMQQVQERNIQRGKKGANNGVDTKASETPIIIL